MLSQRVISASTIAALVALCAGLSGCIVIPARGHYRGSDGGAYSAAPVSGGVWVSGYWGWIGGRRAWVDGHYEGRGR